MHTGITSVLTLQTNTNNSTNAVIRHNPVHTVPRQASTHIPILTWTSSFRNNEMSLIFLRPILAKVGEPQPMSPVVKPAHTHTDNQAQPLSTGTGWHSVLDCVYV